MSERKMYEPLQRFTLVFEVPKETSAADLARRVAELERRVAELEAMTAGAATLSDGAPW